MAKAKAAPKSRSAKSKTVSKADLIKTVAEGAGGSKTDVKAVLDQMLHRISGHLDKGKKVQLTGFGTFEVRSRKARTGVRPGTTEKIKIPASKYPAFKPGKGLKDSVKK
ncbi:MAG: HU family DNA-binding protein [Trueperaceae bacterium]|nr:HU family DNA-binding protein [Trueperaceae bacterium]